MIDTNKGFELKREYDATPEQLWRAWTDEDEAAEWMHPAGVHTPRPSVSIDAKVGGRYAYTMVNDTTSEESPTAGVYREVEPLKKLVFTWGDPSEEPDDALLVTVTIQDLGELTRLRLDVRGYDGMRGDEFIFDGWDSALDELANHVGQTPVAG